MSEDLQKTTQGKIQAFEAKVQALMKMGGEKQVKKQHDGGKMTARERLEYLFDTGTFQAVQLFVKHHATLFGMDKK
jgi:methylmalonyl-CoA decarboxylase subunit alpha